MGFLALLIIWAGALYVLFALTSLLWLFGAFAVIGAAGLASSKIGVVWVGAFVFLYFGSGLLALTGLFAVFVASTLRHRSVV